MATTILSATLLGVRAVPIEVEVDLLNRLPAVCIVGLPASAVRESAERVRSALESSSEEFPRKRVVINLAPADLRKEGTSLDLPVALGVLTAAERIPQRAAQSILAAGELSLDGRLRPIRGALSLAVTARDLGKILVVPRANAQQAAMVPGVTVWPADDLAQVVRWLTAEEAPEVAVAPAAAPSSIVAELSEVRGQHRARRALEVAAAGGHHLLMMGPPGCGLLVSQDAPSSLVPPSAAIEAAIPATTSTSEITPMKTQTKPIETTPTVPEPFVADWTIAPHAWAGRCPSCGSVAVFRETRPGVVSGACSGPASKGCWWVS